jgi:hypothetical protein
MEKDNKMYMADFRDVCSCSCCNSLFGAIAFLPFCVFGSILSQIKSCSMKWSHKIMLLLLREIQWKDGIQGIFDACKQDRKVAVNIMLTSSLLMWPMHRNVLLHGQVRRSLFYKLISLKTSSVNGSIISLKIPEYSQTRYTCRCCNQSIFIHILK